MTPARKAPGAEPQSAVLVTARIAGQERPHRLFLVEQFSLSGGLARAEDSLSLPAPDDLRPVTTRPARIDKFFLDLTGLSGYWFSDLQGVPAIPDWQYCWQFMERSDLVDLRLLLAIFFPTLAARSLSDLTAAFRLEFDASPELRLQRLIEICESKARSLSRGQLRQLKKHSASTKAPWSAWIDQLKPSATATEFDIDATWFSDLDRYSALTDGETLSPEQTSDLLADREQGEKLIEGFELRQGQARYASAVSKALQSEQFLLAEAATGTGKSIGYLLPTVAAIQATKSRAIVVTRTKSLQGQLFLSDLRKLRRLLPPGFKAALLKGIANYLCLLRYKSWLGEVDSNLTSEQVQAQLALQIWQEETASGDLAEVELLTRAEADVLTAQVTIDEQGCLGQHCPYYLECYAFRARRRAQKSDLVITN
ncbi:MAG: DEAD/DEAH box helicase, partial [bacterium]